MLRGARLSAALLSAALVMGIAQAKVGSTLPPTNSSATRPVPNKAKKYVRDQLLVRFRSGLSKQTMQAHHAAVGAAVQKEFGIVENLQLVRLPAGMTVPRARRLYRSRPDVLYAEPDYYRYALQSPVMPNDPLYPDMWDLHNPGQSGGTIGADIHAPEAWSLSTGSSNVVVAVIDSGIAYTHPDLSANVWSSPGSYTVPLSTGSITCAAGTHGLNAITRKCDPLDDNSHGTHVSGTIGASGNNGIGAVGINWRVQVMACKFLDAGGSGTTSNLITCLQYVALMKDNGVNVVATNNSYGGDGFSQAEKDAIDSHRQRGILFVAAAGNAFADNDYASFYPANYGLPHMISVAATDRKDAMSWFSNFGRGSVHLGAPGDEILSTVPPAGYAVYSGTSMAAPHVTAVAALLKAQDGTRDWKAVRNLILAGGDNVPSMAKTISQKRLNAYGSLSCSNSLLQQRLQPLDTDVYVSGGDMLSFQVLNINCDVPNGLLEVPVDGGPEAITFHDDGVSPDLEANDGMYVAQRQWLASEVGDHVLAFPNHDLLTVHVIPPLPPYAYTTDVPFNYRDIEGTELNLRDDDSAIIHPPFPVQIGGVNFSALSVNSNGNVTAGSFIEWENSPLPASGPSIMVAPFWDDLDAVVRWAVTGSAPNRELVVEWREAFAMMCMWSELPYEYATFQIVFFENSSDILFNYDDVMLGSYDPFNLFRGCGEEVSSGASATVGIQSTPNLANQFSFMKASLSDHSSILWSVGQLKPAITQLSPFAALAGASTLTLDVQGRSYLPGAVVRWNGSDRPTSFVNAGELTASIPDSDLASPATVQITVRNPSSSGGHESAAVPFFVHSSYPVPTVTGVIPSPVLVQIPTDSFTKAGMIVDIIGADFTPGAIARWNGLPVADTTVVDGTHLRATVIVGTVARIAAITVVNPAPGGGTSNTLAVDVVNPTPAIGGVPFVGAGSAGFTLTLYGSGFVPASVLRWNGSVRSTRSSGGMAVSAEILPSDVASPGTAQLTVFNPSPGGGISNPRTISILPPPINDRFSSAILINAFPFTMTENTPGATADPQDPMPPCIVQPPLVLESVWFTFTPPTGGGFVTVDTIGSNYDHDLSAWTGTPGSLVPLDCTYNYRGNYMLWPLSFPAGSSPVHFMVSTRYLGSTGTLKLNINVGAGFRLGAAPANQSIPHGSTATYTITVTPQFGSFNDPIALSCYVDPPGPLCSLSAPSVIPGSVATPVTLGVATSTLAHVATPGKARTFLALWIALPAFGLLTIGFISKENKKTKRIIVPAFLLTVVFAGVLAACGGGSSSNGGGGGIQPPPPQTYTITVIGTSSTISQQTTTSLTVTF